MVTGTQGRPKPLRKSARAQSACAESKSPSGGHGPGTVTRAGSQPDVSRRYKICGNKPRKMGLHQDQPSATGPKQEIIESSEAMDWTGCNLVEIDPEKVGGTPVVKGTRVPADVVLVDEEYGRTPEQTHGSFPTLPVATIRQLRAFAHSREPQLQP